MIAAVTPSTPDRSNLLRDATASAAAQLGGPPDVHLVAIDHARRGPAAVRNDLAQSVRTGWLAFLDDDDTWDPGHLEALRPHTDTADVIYSLATIEGRPGWNPQQNTFDPERLRHVNYIPLSGLVRAELFHDVGGFPTDDRLYEDHGLWLALLDAGARFHCVPKRTWRYRFGAWDSRSKEVWDGRRPPTSPVSLA